MPTPPYWSISGKRSGPSNYDGIKMPSRLDNVTDLQNLVAAMRIRGLDQPVIENWLGILRMPRARQRRLGSNRAIRVLSPACFPSRLTAKLSMRLRMRETRAGSTTTTLDLLGCALRTALGQIGSICRRPHERLWSKLSRTDVTRKGHSHIDFCQHDPPSPRIFLAVRTAASPLGGPLFSAGSHC